MEIIVLAEDETIGAAADHFTDDHALSVRTEQGLAVLVGCSHRGQVHSILAPKAAAGVGAVDRFHRLRAGWRWQNDPAIRA